MNQSTQHPEGNSTASKFVQLLLLNFSLVVLLRTLEIILVYWNFGSQENLIGLELLGLLKDTVTSSVILLFLYPIFFIAVKRFPKTTVFIFVSGLIFFTVLHVAILFYFLYQLAPLDTFFYYYPLEEQFFVVRAMGYNSFHIIGGIMLVSFVIFGLFRLIKKRTLSERFVKRIRNVSIALIPLKIFMVLFGSENASKFELNKSFFFYSRSISYYLEKQETNAAYTEKDATDFQRVFGSKTTLNKEFPLLHAFDTTDVLGPLFNQFDRSPNVVILIVEGLNDDFIHPYKGIELMPFLNSLQQKSLYWDHCFTLGERSFAAVPCLTGSLPYAESGFTMQEQFPRHLSLFSILKSNGYQTTYFYGQGAWFHNMNLYLKYQHTDLTVDNSCFSEKYKKIVVGKEHFFWGYHDKDVFNQSLDVLDTIRAEKRFNVYFTGSMHSPFQISEVKKYEDKLAQATKHLKNKTDRDLFTNLKRFYITIPFADDALKSFFEKYSKRPEFENTVFIITGDHPMTEVPRANLLKRYHVPLIVYSPKLKSPRTFSSVTSHLDVYESLLAFLKKYHLKVPEMSTALGSKLPISSRKQSGKFAFMNDNRELIDYYEDGYFISRNQLFKVDQQLNLHEIEDSKRLEELKKHLQIFKKTSRFVALSDKIIPRSLFCKYLFYDLIHANSSKKLAFQGEFENLFKKVKIPASGSYLSVSVDYACQQPEAVSFVFELTDEKDSSLLWAGTPLKQKTSAFQERFTLGVPDFNQKQMYLKAYFWNGKKQKVELNNLDVLIYKRKIRQ